MSGPLPAPPTVATDVGNLLISGLGKYNDILISDGSGRAHWGRIPSLGMDPALIAPASMRFLMRADTLTLADGATIFDWPSSANIPGSLSEAFNANAFPRPVFRATGGPRGLPCVQSAPGACQSQTGSGQLLTPAGDLTYYMVINPDAGGAIQDLMGAGWDQGASLRLEPALTLTLAQTGVGYHGSSLAALTAGQWNLIIVTFNATTNTTTLQVNSTIQTIVAGGAATVFSETTLAFAAGGTTGDYPFYGKTVELGGWASVLTANQLLDLQHFLSYKYGLT